ncbi:kinase [Thraustotheca clavata]|uniref:Kinase n=1 Tax=Thraustotheca clavata TaxID=74557 RepID=A0A1V9ZXZ2_9STRA|nr:kinase [Thraustotheca clavata]
MEALPSDKERLKILVQRCKLSSGSAVQIQAALDEANKKHQNEIEKYQEKLKVLSWELNMLKESIEDAKPCPVNTVEATNFSSSDSLVQSNIYHLYRGVLQNKDVVRKNLSNNIFCNEESKYCALKKLKSSFRLVPRLNGDNSDCILKPTAVSGYGTENLAVYTEYMEHGDLISRMEDKTLPPLNNYTKLEIALRVIKAIVDIHAMNLLHRDINPSHVLLDKKDFAKLSGLSNVRELAEMMTSNVGLKRYAAPETFEDDANVSKYTEKADIYSFGLLLVFLFTGNAPFSDVVDKQKNPINDLNLMGRIMSKEVDTSKHPATPFTELDTLICNCTIMDSEHRPSATEVMNQIKKLVFERLPAPLTNFPVINAIVTVVNAREIHNGDTFGHQDVRCNLQINSARKQTRFHQNGGVNPVWNQLFEFNDVHLMNDVINFNLRKSGLIWTGDLGCTLLKLQNTIETQSHSLQVNYQGREKGTLTVNVQLIGDVRGWLQHYIVNIGTYFAKLGSKQTNQSLELAPKLERAQEIFARMS